MPQHKSSEKRVRQEARRRVHNRAMRSKMRTLYKKVFRATTKEEAEPLMKQAVSTLDKMAAKGHIHKNNAANKKSNIITFYNNL